MNGIRRWTRDRARRGLRKDRGDSGQALAEIAIALPVLLLMMVGIFEFARAYQIQQVVVNAAREGARNVVLPDTDTAGARIVVQNYLAGGNISGETISFSGTEDTGVAMTVAVSVPYSFSLVGPMIRLATGHDGGPGDITLSSQATMRHE